MKKNTKKAILIFAIMVMAAVSVFAKTVEVSSTTGLSNAFSSGSSSNVYKLTKDIVLSSSLTCKKSITLDLAGYTITTGKYTLTAGSSSDFTLTIKDSSTTGSGKIVGNVAVTKNATLTLNSGTIKGTVTVTGTVTSGSITESPTLNVSGGAIVGDIDAIYGDMNIKSGSITGEVDLQWMKVTMSGGTITGDVSVSGIINSNSYYGSTTQTNLSIEGGTIKGDLNVSHTTVRVEDNSNATIDGNINASSDGTLVLYDCTVTGNVTASGSGDVRLHGGTEIEGNLSSTGSSDVECDGITVGGAITTSSSGKLTIESGTFNGAINEGANDSITISGGTYASNPSDCLAEGTYAYADENGKYNLIDWKPAAVVGSTPYKTLAAAVTAAKEGDTILIASDVTGDVTINKNITLDLNGKTLNGDISVATGTSLSVIDSDKDGKGLADGLLSAAASGNLEIESGRFSTDPSDYLAEGKYAKYDREESVFIVTTPSNSASLTLEGNIGINLFIDLESYTDDDDAYIILEYDRPITIKGESLPESTTIRGFTMVNNKVKLSIPVGPVQLINSVSIYLYDGNDVLLYCKENYTAMEFCRSVISNASLYEEGFVELCKTLLNYGSMTQTYFNAQTGNLPNAGLDIDGDVTSLSTSSWGDYYGEFSKNLPQYVGTSLICSTNMVVRHYFKDSLDGYTVALTSKPAGSNMEITTGDNTTGYYVEVYGIESPYLDSNYTISLTDTNTGDIHTITYSPMCYARKTVSRSTSKASLVNLCKSIYLYGSAAQEYFIGE